MLGQITSGLNQTLIIGGPRQSGRSTFTYGLSEPEIVEKSTLIFMLFQNFFQEVLRETTLTNTRQLDIAVKMSVLDALHTKTARNTESLKRNEEDEEFELNLKPPGHTFQSGEYIRDLLDLENSRNIRLSRGKGIAKNLTEQFVSNP